MGRGKEMILSRTEFFSELNALLQAPINDPQMIGLIVLGINRFRRINNIYGYEVGDELLNKMASRLLNIFSEENRVARLANSEFGIILTNIKHDGQVILAANKIIKMLQEPFQILQHSIKVRPVIGIALQNQNVKSASDFLKQAEGALVLAKSNNAPFLVYSDALTNDVSGSADIESKLNSAIEEGELELFYQPKICFKTGMPSGAEALIRWSSPTLGLMNPNSFIPIAEQTGQIIPLTFWTLNTALRQLNEWPHPFQHLSISVNFSAIATQHEDFVDKIHSALQIWGVKPERLTIEITESALLSDPARTFEILNQLKALGVHISIDDFGTGYSSLSYFKNIPASELKIDQSFVSNLTNNKADSHITKTIISIAHGFDLKVVAEGIEDSETYQTLFQLGCDYAQGFYIGHPMPHTAFLKWLASFNSEKFKVAS